MLKDPYKHALRRQMRARRAAIPPQLRVAAAQALVPHMDDFRFAAFLPPPGAVLATYCALEDEIDPAPLALALYQRGYRLALPRILPEGLVFAAYTPGDSLVSAPFGTSEPTPSAPLVMPDLFLTPLLAFDAAFNRLVYGKGYYDRVFAQNPRPIRIGLAFACQQVAAVPVSETDQKLHLVLTEAGLA